jgi:hypothetical protein
MTSTRKQCRTGEAACRPSTLKEALDCLAHHSDRTVAQMAEAIGHTTAGTLGKQLSLHDEDNYPPVRLVVPLTLVSKNDAVVRYLAEAVGGRFVRESIDASPVDGAGVARMLREFGELLEAVSAAMADGRVTDDEVARVDREWDDVARVAAAVRVQLRSAAEGRR